MEIETKALYWRSIKGYSFSFNITRSTSTLVFLRFDHSYLSILYLYAACSTISWFYFSIISFRNPSLVRQILIRTQTDGFRKRTTNKLNWRNQLQRTQKWPLNNTKQQQQKNKNKKQTDKQNKTKKNKTNIKKRRQQKRNKQKKNTHTQKTKI